MKYVVYLLNKLKHKSFEEDYQLSIKDNIYVVEPLIVINCQIHHNSFKIS